MFNKDAYHHYPYSSRRNVIHAKNGMVATSEPKAAQVGIDIMKKGGNAVDAAIATAAALTVVEPTSNGIGGDAFAIVYMNDKLHGLNASGKAPSSLSIEALKKKGYDEMPKFGLEPVTVPGVPSAWAALSERFGALPLEEVLKPAATLAREGYPLSPHVAENFKNAFKAYDRILKSDVFKPLFETFLAGDNVPESGNIIKLPDHADTLEMIGKTNAKAFYEGEIAEKIDEFSKKHGGYITKEDLKNHKPEWVKPLSMNYKGIDVYELPPNTQGMVALSALGILNHLETATDSETDALHKNIEALKLAFEDGKHYIGEPNTMTINEKTLLDDRYLEERSKLISDEAQAFEPGAFKDHGTVYLSTADKDGNMVSYIQSNYMGFGSGVVVEGTGIALQNRGHNFSMNKDSQNALAPGKRPYHTIIPGFLMEGDIPIGPFGVMGGFMQPQGHLQVVTSMIDDHLNPQAALDRPRWQWEKGKTIMVEPTMPHHLVKSLERRGHQIRIEHRLQVFGRGQIILRNKKTGVYTGGTESRCDGHIAAY